MLVTLFSAASSINKGIQWHPTNLLENQTLKIKKGQTPELRSNVPLQNQTNMCFPGVCSEKHGYGIVSGQRQHFNGMDSWWFITNRIVDRVYQSKLEQGTSWNTMAAGEMEQFPSRYIGSAGSVEWDWICGSGPMVTRLRSWDNWFTSCFSCSKIDGLCAHSCMYNYTQYAGNCGYIISINTILKSLEFWLNTPPKFCWE